MPAWSPIQYVKEGTYLLPVVKHRPESAFQDVEWIPRELLESMIAEGKVYGEVVTPFIHYGLH